jgi:predicted P-loop ATPase
MTSGNAAGAKIRPDFEVIEKIAGSFSRWCVWGYKERGDGSKPAKVPSDGRRAISTRSPGDWLSFDQARKAYERGGFDGVGVLINGNAPVVAIDIDGCLDEFGNVLPEFEAVVAALMALCTYVEISPSGTGLRGFIHGITPEDVPEKVGGVEIYDTCTAGRYVTITGHPWGAFREIGRSDEAGLAELLRVAGFFDSHGGVAVVGGGEGGEAWTAITDDDLLALLRRNNKRGAITRLLKGDITGYAGDSEARAALIGHIAYYSRDVGQVDRLMRGSGLMKSKLDEARSGELFSTWEIKRVLAGIDKTGGGSYWVDRAEREAGTAIEKAAEVGMLEKARDVLVGGLAGITNSKGKIQTGPVPLAELLYRDKRLTGAVWFDEFAQMPMKTPAFEAIGGGRGEALTDRDYRAVEAWLAREWAVSLKAGEIRRVVLAWADKTAINHVTEKLDEFAAAWDGQPRVGQLLADYFGAHVGDDEGLRHYVSEIGIRFMVGVVARAFEPGCKLDTMLNIESPQGKKKSTGVKELTAAISPRAFLEGFSLDKLDRDAKQALRGKLIGECAELDGMSKHEAGTLKNFLSCRVDHYRDPYGLTVSDWPRSVVLVGTTNEDAYLRDPTGNRRFWPVKVGRVDIDAIRRDAEQLWGEAVRLYRAGKRWWVEEDGDEDAKLRTVQRREVLKRMVADTWVEMLEEFNERLVLGRVDMVRPAGAVADAEMSFRLVELMAMVFEDGTTTRRTLPEETRFRAALVRAGWVHNGSTAHGRWRLSAGATAEARRRVS